MSKEEERKLSAYYHSLKDQLEIFRRAAESPASEIRDHTVELLKAEVERINQDFPDVIPGLDEREFLKDPDPRWTTYYAEPIWCYLIQATSRLKSELDDLNTMPVTEERDFSFVKDADLRRILERDYQEVQRAYLVEAWKSTIILSGGAIEAILTDLLLANESTARSATAAPSEPDIRKWKFVHLINVAVELGLINIGLEKFSHSVREYRNLVHPGNEIREHLKVEKEEAKIALEVLNMVHRELSGP